MNKKLPELSLVKSKRSNGYVLSRGGVALFVINETNYERAGFTVSLARTNYGDYEKNSSRSVIEFCPLEPGRRLDWYLDLFVTLPSNWFVRFISIIKHFALSCLGATSVPRKNKCI